MKKLQNASAITTVAAVLLFLVFRRATSPLVFVTVFFILVALVTRPIVYLLEIENIRPEAGKPLKEKIFVYAFCAVVLLVFAGILVYLVSSFLDSKMPIIRAHYF